MKKLTAALLLLTLALSAGAQEAAPPDAPRMEFALRLKVTLGKAFSCGETPHGQRTVIPITGGTFEGPDLKGTILEGGADYQLSDPATGRTDVEAIYNLRTDDGVNIHIRNRGMIVMDKAENGRPSFYFRCAPTFEAPNDSKYAWLNKAIFVCAPQMGQGAGITLRVWKGEKDGLHSLMSAIFLPAASDTVCSPNSEEARASAE